MALSNVVILSSLSAVERCFAILGFTKATRAEWLANTLVLLRCLHEDREHLISSSASSIEWAAHLEHVTTQKLNRISTSGSNVASQLQIILGKLKWKTLGGRIGLSSTDLIDVTTQIMDLYRTINVA
ncbi:hypothetical protein BT96DRAFT_273944 [Gymnopus androsaceus JB14]|uniref:Uncharacterized protein n=1 Tax=Gymnopus androsaceus JB14 TaxID=1447944 RepID=A0A6A4H2I0_9AGAR|nr:hypothetical protein BT96DRAFT_273944 [Gymnopus androsaceus JB14]